MSKVISFSISDRYLEKIRSLYPDMTDNLAAKQFLTDRLDASLDARLDDKLETMIQTRLDATVGKSISSLTERLAKLEARLDDGLDDMEPLLKREREASIASPDPSDDPAIDQKLTNLEIGDILGCHSSNLSKWVRTGHIPKKYRDKCEFNHNKTKIVLI